MTITVCPNCNESFSETHDYYKPKQKIVAQGDEAPDVRLYCSDACLNGLKNLKDIHGHDVRSMDLTTSMKYGDKYTCLKCMETWEIKDLKEKA